MYDVIFIESPIHNLEVVKKIKNHFVLEGNICFSNFIRKIKQQEEMYYEKNVKILNLMIKDIKTIMFYFYNNDDILKDYYNDLYKNRSIMFNQITCIDIGENINDKSAYNLIIKHIKERI